MDLFMFVMVLVGFAFLPDLHDPSVQGLSSGDDGDMGPVETAGGHGDLLSAEGDDDGSSEPSLTDWGTDGDPAEVEVLSDTAEVETESDDLGEGLDQTGTSFVGFDESGDLHVAQVTDFEIGEDVLAVEMNQDAVNGTLEVEVENSDNGMDSMVYVEQELIAVLQGTPDVNAQDVMVAMVTMTGQPT